MRESRKYGSVRGALSNERPYRDEGARPSWRDSAGARSYAGVADEVVPVRFSTTISRIGETNGSPHGEHSVRRNQ
jgi:hypothetical protein